MPEHPFTRRRFVTSAGAAALAGSFIGLDPVRTVGPSTAQAAASAPRGRDERPNILLILVDDLGYSDIGAYGSEIRTPNLDRLARTGTRFTGATNNARCCPTRASILTGLYPTQTGVGYMIDDDGLPGYRGRLNESCHTIGEVLGGAGYRTGYYGKWHVAPFESGVVPATRGFDRSYGVTNGGWTYYRPNLYRDEQVIGRPSGEGYYLTDDVTDEAIAGMGKLAGRGDPFLMMLCYNAPHYPLNAREEDIAPYREVYRKGWDQIRQERFERQQAEGLVDSIPELPPKDGTVPDWDAVGPKDWQIERMAVYAAMVTAMDRGVGRVLAELERLGERDDTVVMFMSDNGGSAEHLSGPHYPDGVESEDGRPMRAGNKPEIMPGPSDTYASYGKGWANVSNTPYRRYKHWTDEGGLATPFIVSWPKRVPSGRTEQRVIHVTDLMPTFVDLGDATYPTEHNGRRVPLPEGRSLAPFLTGTGDANGADWDESRRLYWEHEGNKAVRWGNWKLVAAYNQPWRLYDLATDAAEQTDLAGSEPVRVDEMSHGWDEWAARVLVWEWNQSFKRSLLAAE